jgi:branched-chain amino acid transport system substrate-binding protein
MIFHRAWTAPLLMLFATILTISVHAQSSFKIGEINSYKAQPAFLEPYKKGMELALEDVNASGGVNGHKLELFTREDNANPGDAVRAGEELLSREGVDVIAGAYLSNIGLALADFAKQRKVFYMAGEPLTDKMVWQNGNHYTFRLRASTYMQVSMLVPEALKMKKKRWALVYPNYEYGQSAAATFKQLMKAQQSDVEFVAELAPPLGKLDAGAVTQALADAKPDAIFNVLFGADLTKFVREGQTRGLFNGREVVSLLTGEPEYLDALKDDTPNGWLVTGYPWSSLNTPEHNAFLGAYQKRFNETPRLGSVVGYTLIKSIAQAYKKAGSNDTEKLIAASRGMVVESPFGKITFRTDDQQSTMGAFIGKTKNDNGKGVLVDAKYMDGAKFQPSAEEVKKLRAVD